MNLTLLSPTLALNALKYVGADAQGQKIMGKKLELLCFEIKGLSYVASGILKQEALSVGAEYATPKEQILYQGQKLGLLFGSKSALLILCAKLKKQDFGLKEVAHKLSLHLNARSNSRRMHTPSTLLQNALDDSLQQIMAIINITPDSFYHKSRKNSRQAIERIYNLLQKGIKYIDIGAASSRPGSDLIESDVEISRLQEVCSEIKTQNLENKAFFSIDTYNPQTAEFALKHGFKIINDVSGFKNKLMSKINAHYNAIAILMHSKGTPKDMQDFTQYENIFEEIGMFFAQKIEEILQAGGKEIILDIGFGFAKTLQQNLALTAHLKHFKYFNYPLLFGASRKSSLGEITKKEPQERLSATLALHLLAIQNGANILRVHDEDEHIDMLHVYHTLQHNHLDTQGLI
ncbi:MAG: dihydropteroate synthase [Helicobacter sp.]|nr:dihydropteroate synthase [Helicobacter sp.]